MEKQLKTLGMACVFLGSTTTICCFFSLALALPIGFLGLISSSIYIYIDTKHEINNSNITPGILSLILSSTPVLLILSLIIFSYFNKH